jgi:Ser/Thr protein kinase RdoA (MazF antagonist)
MLSKSDAELARRDAAIPSLPLLFDEEALTRRLNQALPHLGIRNLSAHYVRYKPGTSCLISYKVETEHTHFDLYAKGMRRGSANKMNKADRRINGSQDHNSGVILDDAGVIVYIYPVDHDVSVLRRLADSQSRRETLKSTLQWRPDLWEVELHTLRYKPERRYVAQMVTQNGPHGLLKAYAGNDYPSAQRGGKIFNSREYLKVAQRLGRSNRHKLVVFEWLDGDLLLDAIQEPAFSVTYMRHVGAALVELHDQRPRRLRDADLRLEIKSLLSTANDLIHLCPAKSDMIAKLAEKLATDLTETRKLYYSIHNDFTADQVLLTDDNVIILDLDEATRGDRYSDLSSFVAGIEYAVLMGEPPIINSRETIDAFLDGYSEASNRRLPANLNRKIAASLLRLAQQPFRSRLPDWPQKTYRIIERAEALANRQFDFGQWLSPHPRSPEPK